MTIETHGYFYKLRALRKNRARRLYVDQTGATSIEYALIASVVSIVIAGVILLLGDQVLALYQQIAAAFGG